MQFMSREERLTRQCLGGVGKGGHDDGVVHGGEVVVMARPRRDGRRRLGLAPDPVPCPSGRGWGRRAVAVLRPGQDRWWLRLGLVCGVRVGGWGRRRRLGLVGGVRVGGWGWQAGRVLRAQGRMGSSGRWGLGGGGGGWGWRPRGTRWRARGGGGARTRVGGHGEEAAWRGRGLGGGNPKGKNGNA
jgi:hypothetical protein